MDSQQTQQKPKSSNVAEPAPMRMRLLAMCYDFLIILFITTVLVMVIELAIVGSKEIATDGLLNKALKVFWFIPGFFYLGYYWTKSGQTPSMKVWKIKVVNRHGLLMSWQQALLRYVFALMGLGIIMAFFNKDRLSLQDVCSNTSLIKIKTITSTAPTTND